MHESKFQSQFVIDLSPIIPKFWCVPCENFDLSPIILKFVIEQGFGPKLRGEEEKVEMAKNKPIFGHFYSTSYSSSLFLNSNRQL